MRRSPIAAALCLLSVSPGLSYEQDDEGWMNEFPVSDYTLATKGGSPYWSLTPGRYVVLGELNPGGGKFVFISVLDETEMVDGVETRVVEEREYKDGGLLEISRNFFATRQETGDIFYFGEDVDDYKDNEIVGHAGQWRAGVDGAKAGLFMSGKPEVGMKYYIEIQPGVALDRAEVMETGVEIETPARTFDDCLIVTETSPLEPDDESYKRFAPNVGMIFDDDLELYKYGKRRRSEKVIEFEIEENQMPRAPAAVVRELHPEGEMKEVKVELHRDHVRYAVETFINGKQWDVEVTEAGEVLRNEED